MNKAIIEFDQRRTSLLDDLKKTNRLGSVEEKVPYNRNSGKLMNAGFDHTGSGKKFYKVKNQSP